MKSYFLLPVLLFAVLVFSSCEKHDVIAISDLEHYVTYEEATSFGKEYLAKFKEHNHGTTLRQNPQIELHKTYYTSLGEEAFYVFNTIYETDTGFLAISADRRILPIIANGEDYPFKDELENLGLQDWITNQIATVEQVRVNGSTADPLTQALWDDTDLWIQGLVAPPSSGDGDDEDPCGNVTMTQYGPLVQTAWGQDCPYNSLTPEEDCFDRCRNEFTLTGCVATAMAQVIRFHEHPANYNYGLLLDRYSTAHFGTPEAMEVSEIMSDAGVSINMDYGCGSSGAYTSDVPSAFKDDFDFANGGDYTSNFKIHEIKDNIKDDLPVILDGCRLGNSTLNCHAWICDGYREFNDGCYGYLFYHMNWGWNGWSNGWYIYNSWRINRFNIDYAIDKNALININPI